MCFYNDCEWYASIHESTEGVEGGATKCSECGRKIADGEWRHHLYQQEHEECQDCMEDAAETEEEIADATTCEHDYGETFTYDRCADCEKLLKAVIAHEVKEECPEDQRQPAYGELGEAFMQHESKAEYGLEAIGMFPELAGHRFVIQALKDAADDEF